MKTKQEKYEIGDSATVTKSGYLYKGNTGKVSKITDKFIFLKFTDNTCAWPFYREDLKKGDSK